MYPGAIIIPTVNGVISPSEILDRSLFDFEQASQGAGYWIATLSKLEQEMMLNEEVSVASRWDEVHGDRQTEMVWIGLDMNREEIDFELDACLLTDDEMESDWTKLADPLPRFVGVN